MTEQGGTVETEIVLHLKFRTKTHDANVSSSDELVVDNDEAKLEAAIDALVNIWEWDGEDDGAAVSDGIFKRVVMCRQEVIERYDIPEEG